MSDSTRSTKRARQSKKGTSVKAQPRAKAAPVAPKAPRQEARKNPALLALLAVVAVAAIVVAVYRATAPLRLDRALRSDSLQELQAASAADPYNPRSFYYLGVRLLQLGQAKPAAQALRRAADLDANDQKSWLGAAIATAADGDIPNALGVVNAYLRRRPNDAAGHFTIAQICDQAGDLQKAYEEASLASRLDPSNGNALRLVAREDLRMEKTEEAEKALRRAIAQNSQDWRAQVDLGNILLSSKEPAAAVACFQKAAGLAPSEALPTLLLGKALLGQAQEPSQVEAARQQILHSAQIQPSNAEVNLQLGICEMRLGHWKDARGDLLQAQLFSPADKTVVSDLVAVDKAHRDTHALSQDNVRLSQLAVYESQKTDLLEKLKANPHDPQSLLKLARLSAANRDDIEASRYFRILMAHFPNLASLSSEAKPVQDRADKELPLPVLSPEPDVLTPDDPPLPVLLRDAASLLARGQPDQAQTAYLAILSRDATLAAAYLGLGQIMDSEHASDQAVVFYEKAVSIDPKTASAQFALAADYEAIGLDDQAILHYRQGLALSPNSADKWGTLGKILATDQNVYDQAEAAYKKAIGLQPHNAEYLRDLADLEVQENKNPAAEAEYRLALAAAPGNPLTQYHLAGFLIANQPTASEPSEASRLLQQASAALPSDPMISYWQGRLALQQGDSKTAITDLLSALPHLHSMVAADAWYSLSRAYLRMGNKELANAAQDRSDRQRKLADYIDAIELQLESTPNRSDYRLKLAQLYTQDGDLDQAATQYRVILRADAGNKAAEAGLKKLGASSSGQDLAGPLG
jgi:tetratricopeptide (TPR) repeat protein